MRAEEARNMMNYNHAMNYITQAALQGKSKVDIPKQYVNRQYLEQQGYRIEGGVHQLDETCTVSWERNWRD
jgi:hypothetical protein